MSTCHHASHTHAAVGSAPANLPARPEPHLPPSGAAASAGYTCPMHPEVQRDAPGDCPICGMALEPRDPSAADDAPELRDHLRRLWVGAPLALLVLVLAMGEMIPGDPLGRWASPRARDLLQLLLAAPVVLWGAAPFFRKGWSGAVALRPNMFTLIALGVGAAFAYSLVAVVAPHAFPASLRDEGGRVPLYFEAAAVITALVLLGQVIELGARRRTGGAIRALLDLAPATARRVETDGVERDVPLASVRVGDVLRVRPGERVPVDGVVLEGESALDESLVTGEPMPVRKAAGDPVTGGSSNGAGTFTLRAERVGADTLLARIVALVADAQRSRAPIQRVVDRVSAWFVPAVLVASAATFVGWMLLGPAPALPHALSNAVAVLIIACPCALGLATPMSILVGTGRGARAGILIRDAAALEALERVDALVVDKTGTVTEGSPRVVAVAAEPGVGERELLALAAGLERGSEHPLAEAVVARAEEVEIASEPPSRFESFPGEGVRGVVAGRDVALGTPAFLGRIGVPLDGVLRLDGAAQAQRSRGATVVLVALDGAAAGFIAVADAVKATAPEALARLRAEGVRVAMSSGDDPRTVAAVASELGLDDARGGASPEDKQRLVAALRSAGHTVAMVGDGVNDGPALAAADVGIAMGAGSDVALGAAALTLVQGDLRGVSRARRLARATMANVRQNLVFAFAYNALGVPLAAGLLYPLTGWLLDPMVASAAMSLSSVSVVANALRLRRVAL